MLIYTDIISQLEKRIPAIKNRIDKEGDYIEGLPHLVFSIVFRKYLIECFQHGKTKEFLQCVDFMEEMLVGDSEVNELLVVSVIEDMLSERFVLSKIKSICSLGLKIQIENSERYYGWK